MRNPIAGETLGLRHHCLYPGMCPRIPGTPEHNPPRPAGKFGRRQPGCCRATERKRKAKAGQYPRLETAIAGIGFGFVAWLDMSIGSNWDRSSIQRWRSCQYSSHQYRGDRWPFSRALLHWSCRQGVVVLTRASKRDGPCFLWNLVRIQLRYLRQQ